jgi:hypothetical protein
MLGMASRTLTDGAWDSWSFELPITFTAYADNPQPALPSVLPGDFSRDGRIDAADYELWRSTFGSMSELAADGNGNRTIDAADYVVWRHGEFSDSSGSIGMSVPETTSMSLFVLACLSLMIGISRKIRKEEIW